VTPLSSRDEVELVVGCDTDALDGLLVGQLSTTVREDDNIRWNATHLRDSVTDLANRCAGFYFHCDGLAATDSRNDFDSHFSFHQTTL